MFKTFRRHSTDQHLFDLDEIRQMVRDIVKEELERKK